MTQPKPPRTPTRDRDVYVAKTPARGVPTFVEEELTGQYEGEELERARARRPTPSRFRHLEGRVDKLTEDVSDLRVEVSSEMSDVKAGMGELAGEVRGLAIVIKDAASRSHVTFTSKVEVDTAEKVDSIDARKGKRDLWLKGAGLLLTGGVAAKILQALGVL
jgi:polyisoprenoid-binding protein YceI